MRVGSCSPASIVTSALTCAVSWISGWCSGSPSFHSRCSGGSPMIAVGWITRRTLAAAPVDAYLLHMEEPGPRVARALLVAVLVAYEQNRLRVDAVALGEQEHSLGVGLDALHVVATGDVGHALSQAVLG